MVNVAIMGHGVVGSGVAEVLLKNADSIARKAGTPVQVSRVLDLRAFPDLPYADRFTTDFEEIVNDPSIRIVVETMGGLHPAYDFVKRCLQAGKSVVTSNKELVAAKGDELLSIARENGQNFLFEASVGGGIPILRPLDQCLAANEVFEIAGILNGTTNFMLTRMIEDGMSFDEALALAQKLGYAERNPAADVEGHDACRKICILAALAFGKHVYPEQVHTEGITAITPEDVQCAAKMDSVIKLIGRVVRRESDGRLYVTVAPMVIPKTNLLADVNDVFNGILVRGDAVGDVVFYGRGAGKLPTASAVVADVIDEIKHLESRKTLFWGPAEEGYVLPYDEAETALLLRVENKNGAAEAARRAFGDITVVSETETELAFVTPRAAEGQLDRLAEQADLTLISRLRVADF